MTAKRTFTSQNHPSSYRKSGYKLVTGEVPDITLYTTIGWYNWVYYRDNITKEELDSKSERKTEFTVNMYPWMPISKEKTIPVAADWIVTMVTPVDKIYQMYEEDILKNGQESNQSNSAADGSETDQ